MDNCHRFIFDQPFKGSVQTKYSYFFNLNSIDSNEKTIISDVLLYGY